MKYAALCVLLGAMAPSQAKPVIACTMPILEVLAREVGGDDFEYFSLSRPDQDPHQVKGTPVLQRKLRGADLFIEIGLQLEPWANEVANESGRTRLQAGQSGRIVASGNIPREQIPAAIDRAQGHIHAQGNPHLWLDPIRGRKIAENIAAALMKAQPARQQAIQERLRDFRKRLDEAFFGKKLVELVGADELERRHFDGSFFAYLEKEELDGKKLIASLDGWLKKGEALRGKKAIEYHQSWTYTAKAFGFEIAGSIEEKPGIPPGPRHQLELNKRLREGTIAFMMVENFYDAGLPQTLSRDTGVPAVILPNQPGGEPGTETYFKFFDHIVEKLAGAAKR